MNKWNEVSKYAILRTRETIEFLIKFKVEEENSCNIQLDLNQQELSKTLIGQIEEYSVEDWSLYKSWAH